VVVGRVAAGKKKRKMFVGGVSCQQRPSLGEHEYKKRRSKKNRQNKKKARSKAGVFENNYEKKGRPQHQHKRKTKCRKGTLRKKRVEERHLGTLRKKRTETAFGWHLKKLPRGKVPKTVPGCKKWGKKDAGEAGDVKINTLPLCGIPSILGRGGHRIREKITGAGARKGFCKTLGGKRQLGKGCKLRGFCRPQDGGGPQGEKN